MHQAAFITKHTAANRGLSIMHTGSCKISSSVPLCKLLLNMAVLFDPANKKQCKLQKGGVIGEKKHNVIQHFLLAEINYFNHIDFSVIHLLIIVKEFVNKLLNYVQSLKNSGCELHFGCCSTSAAQSKCKMNPQTTAPATSLRHYLLSSLAKGEDTKNLSAAWNGCSRVWALFNCAIYQPKRPTHS